MSLSNTLPFSSKASQIFNNNNSEGEQLPASEFSVFASVNIPNPYQRAEIRTSQSTLNQTTLVSDDTISITSSMAPEIPRRSNSIISMTNNAIPNTNSSVINFDKPLLSPRMIQHHNQHQSVSPMDGHHHHHHTHSEQTSPSIHKSNPYQRAGIRTNGTTFDVNERSSPGYNPSSPRFSDINDFNGQQLPISPHVNVPNAHNFNHIPPPLPPRKKHPRKNPNDYINSQLRQAADAPILLPRDMDPPPLPPRQQHHSTSNNFNTWHFVSCFFCVCICVFFLITKPIK